MKSESDLNDFSFSCKRLDYYCFIDELLQAVSWLKVYANLMTTRSCDFVLAAMCLKQKDCLMSYSIEGVQVSLEDLLSVGVVNLNDNSINKVVNYIDAISVCECLLRVGRFSEKLITLLHGMLYDERIISKTNPKRIRINDLEKIVDSDLSAGRLPYIPQRCEEISRKLQELTQYLNAPNDNYHPLIRAALLHAQITVIHPFEKGNELIARMLVYLYMCYEADNMYPYLFINEALFKDRYNYLRLLKKAHESEDWNEWVKYFLSIVARQCKKHVGLLTKLHSQFTQEVTKASKTIKSYDNAFRILMWSYCEPIFDAKLMCERSKLPMASLNRYLAALVDEGILCTNGKKRNRLYFNTSLMAMLQE